MYYPLISEYIEAIKSAEDNFKELSYLRPVLGNDGLPVITSGNFAAVFKMKDEQSGKFYAMKCFTKEQEGRAEAYREITKELKDVSSPYLVSIQYLERELYVDTNQSTETEFPILLMDWVEGKTLDNYLRENLDDKYALEMLAYQFSQLSKWLIPQPFAHGDLKPDNILVREDGSLVLCDYDGMYVPAMKGQKARELGSPDFRHPLRTENDFNERIDDFPFASILLSLKAISICPQFLDEYGAQDRLLFSEKDYREHWENYPNQCELWKRLCFSYDNELNKCLRFYDNPHCRGNRYQLDLEFEEPQIEVNKVTSISFEEWENRVEDFDWYGANYSRDYRKLMLFSDTIGFEYCGESWDDSTIECIVSNKTNIICDNCFTENHSLRYFTIPQSVQYVGKKAFNGCPLRYIELPDSICYISEDAFDNCFDLHTIIIPPRTYDKFSKMLPRNVNQLHEINMDTVKSKLFSFLNQNAKKGKSYWYSLTWFVETICSIYGIFEEAICEIQEYNSNGGKIVIKAGKNNDRDGNGCYYASIVNNRDSIDEIINSIIRLLLDFNGVSILNRVGILYK